jgi:hypothetical protein
LTSASAHGVHGISSLHLIFNLLQRSHFAPILISLLGSIPTMVDFFMLLTSDAAFIPR